MAVLNIRKGKIGREDLELGTGTFSRLKSDGSTQSLSRINTDQLITLPGGTRTVTETDTYLSNNAVHNVKDYGAIGDGSTDDSETIQKALDAADTDGGGVVYVPDGEYLLESGLTIGDNTTLLLSANAVLIRDFATDSKPDGATIRNKLAPQAADLLVDPGPFNQTTSNTNISIIGGTIQTVKSANKGPHIVLAFADHSEIRDVRFRGVFGNWNVTLLGSYLDVSGLDIDSGTTIFEDGVHIWGGDHITISDCRIKCGDDAIIIGANHNFAASDISISNIVVDSTQGNAIKLAHTRAGDTASFATPTEKIQRINISNISGTAGVTRNGLIATDFTGNTSDDLLRDVNISNVALKHGLIANNTVNPWGVYISGGLRISLDSIVVDSPIRSAFRIQDAADIAITNCSAFGIQETASGRFCIDANDVTQIIVTGGSFTNTTTHVSRFRNCTDVIINGCKMKSNPANTAGILLDGTTTRVIISGVICTSASSAGQGIRVNADTVSEVQIIGCSLKQNATPLLESFTGKITQAII